MSPQNSQQISVEIIESMIPLIEGRVKSRCFPPLRRTGLDDIAQNVKLKLVQYTTSGQLVLLSSSSLASQLTQLRAWIAQAVDLAIMEARRMEQRIGLLSDNLDPLDRAEWDYTVRVTAVNALPYLDRLSVTERLIIEAKVFDGRKFADIARELGLTSGNVRAIFRRTRLKLRRMLEQDMPKEFQR